MTLVSDISIVQLLESANWLYTMINTILWPGVERLGWFLKCTSTSNGAGKPAESLEMIPFFSGKTWAWVIFTASRHGRDCITLIC